LSALNANKGKKGVSNKNDYFLLDQDKSYIKKNQMDYPSYELYKNKYDRFLDEESKKKKA